MAEVLTVALSTKDEELIARLAAKARVRVKSVTDATHAKEWLALKAIDAVCIGTTLDDHDMQKLIRAVWQAHPLAEIVIVAEEEGWSLSEGLLLLGVPLASGADRDSILERLLRRVADREPPSSHGTVLVVEDLDAPRDIICSYIEQLGLGRAHGVRSAQEALHHLESDPQGVTCIVTDIRMPEMSGDDLIRHVRAARGLSHLPVVVLTAYGTVDALIRCLKAGASGFLVKPPKRDDLRYEILRANRIVTGHASPRLVHPEEAERLRDYLIERGYMSA